MPISPIFYPPVNYIIVIFIGPLRCAVISSCDSQHDKAIVVVDSDTHNDYTIYTARGIDTTCGRQAISVGLVMMV